MSNLVTLTTNLKNIAFRPRDFNVETLEPERSPLLDRSTEFTTKQFGNDQPEYGSSGLPYIKTIVPPTPYLLSTTGPGFPLYTPGTTGNLDYPIRGGSVEFQIGQQTFTLSNRIDAARIKAFFDDPKRGPLFIQKQIGLQLTNPKIETGNTLQGIGQGNLIPGLLENTRVYNNGVNTLAQVRVQGTGAHALRHGTVPFNLFEKNYFAVVNKQNVDNNLNTNRLLNLTQLKMSAGSPIKNPENVLDINTVNTLGISLNRNLLFQYLGGPGSAYGIGSTTISRTEDTTKLGTTMKVFASRNAMTYDQIRQQQTQYKTQAVLREIDEFTGETVPDFINTAYKVTDETKLKTFKTQDYQTGGNWGKENRESRFYYTVPNGRGADKMNSSYPFKFDNAENPWEVVGKTEATDDLIKLVFEIVNNDNTSESVALFFRAFLTSGITDNNSATWNSFKYLGRGDNFYTYQGFDRSISFSFRVAAEHSTELPAMYNRLNMLATQVLPDYSSANIMRAPIIVLTLGDYLIRTPGFLESVNLTTSQESSWEIDKGSQLPYIVDVTISFKPIPNVLPRRNYSPYEPPTIKEDIALDSTETTTNANEDDTTTPGIRRRSNRNRLDRRQDREERRAERRAARFDKKQAKLNQQNMQVENSGFTIDPSNEQQVREVKNMIDSVTRLFGNY